MKNKLLEWSLRAPAVVFAAMAALVLVAGLQIPAIHIDTDPENMLPADQADRLFHREVKKEMGLHDAIVVGVVNESDPDGVFNPTSLARLDTLTKAITGIDGVIAHDVLSLATVDNVEQAGPGTIHFEWMMKSPPTNRAGALAIRDAVNRIPMFRGSLVSENGKAAAIQVPVVEKSESHRVATEIEKVIAGLHGDERYFITGLPVAEDRFGVEMFQEMAVSAPAAGLVIFLMMWAFFRSVSLIASPMIVALATVITTMGGVIGLGYPVHIMTSMIPIFLMPIAVVDSVHMLSEFSDLYRKNGDARVSISATVRALFKPMLYTSLTSAAGFASLALTPIPPVRVFGVFVAVGILLAFVFTVFFIPAYVVSLSPARLEGLTRATNRASQSSRTANPGGSMLARGLRIVGDMTVRFRLAIIAGAAVLAVVSVWGMSLIQINDNPVRWFKSDHPIRVADRVLNEHFDGTYMAFLVLDQSDASRPIEDFEVKATALIARAEHPDEYRDTLDAWRSATKSAPAAERITALITALEAKLDAASDTNYDTYASLLDLAEDAQVQTKYFQSPAALHYIEGLQKALAEGGLVGKTTSLADVVKTVHRDLREGKDEFFSIPTSAAGVGQTLLSYQSSHRPNDLWHLVTPDFRRTSTWVQLESGDNQAVSAVVHQVDDYIAAHPLPDGVKLRWAGLPYLNVIWQEQMVKGMSSSLMGSFVIVLLMMVFLYRSLWLGLLSMLPLSLTIALIYGVLGLVGKDYDMPVAVLSSLTLGLSVDFAIHFIERAREIYPLTGHWYETVRSMFEEPARAISRNAIVIAVGFLPLLAAPLRPYITVGILMATIMAVSSVVTLLLLPAVLGTVPRILAHRRNDSHEVTRPQEALS